MVPTWFDSFNDVRILWTYRQHNPKQYCVLIICVYIWYSFISKLEPATFRLPEPLSYDQPYHHSCLLQFSFLSASCYLNLKCGIKSPPSALELAELLSRASRCGEFGDAFGGRRCSPLTPVCSSSLSGFHTFSAHCLQWHHLSAQQLTIL